MTAGNGESIFFHSPCSSAELFLLELLKKNYITAEPAEALNIPARMETISESHKQLKRMVQNQMQLCSLCSAAGSLFSNIAHSRLVST